MRVAIASIRGIPPEFRQHEVLAASLRERGAVASIEAWDDPGVDWQAFDLVVIRSTWDYAWRRDEFLAWADSIGERLQNPPALVRWNTDKRYLGDLAAAGLPVVNTRYVTAADPAPELQGEVVVKPSVSASARDTGRFGPAAHAGALDLIEAITAGGRTAMVQPFLPAADGAGETAIAFVDGRPSHALRKRGVLAPDEVAPTRNDALGAAEPLYDPALVTASEASDDELEVASAIIAEITRRFGGPPLYARVDMLRDADDSPRLLEFEAVEPNLYHEQAPGSADVLAEAILRRVSRD